MRRFLFLGMLLLVASPLAAQTVLLYAEKDGDDVKLIFSGGGAPYEILAARQPQMSVRTETIDDNATSPTFHSGALSDGIKNWFYVVCSVSSPRATITSPANGFITDKGCIIVSGTYTPGTEHVYVNTFAADMADGKFTCCSGPVGGMGAPLAVGPGIVVPIIAAANDAGDDWCHARVEGSWSVSGVSRFSCVERSPGH